MARERTMTDSVPRSGQLAVMQRTIEEVQENIQNLVILIEDRGHIAGNDLFRVMNALAPCIQNRMREVHGVDIGVLRARMKVLWMIWEDLNQSAINRVVGILHEEGEEGVAEYFEACLARYELHAAAREQGVSFWDYCRQFMDFDEERQ
jgi:hypothetical protein